MADSESDNGKQHAKGSGIYQALEAMEHRLRAEIVSLRRDVTGIDAHTASKALLARVTALEVAFANLNTAKGRASKIIDNIAGQLLTAIIILIAAALVFFKSLPSDAAARINSIPPATAKEIKQ